MVACGQRLFFLPVIDPILGAGAFANTVLHIRINLEHIAAGNPGAIAVLHLGYCKAGVGHGGIRGPVSVDPTLAALDAVQPRTVILHLAVRGKRKPVAVPDAAA
ncbi:hypothetical protein D3C75_861920 [compost metagenome]